MLVSALTLLAFLAPDYAYAQTFPCPNGPGPGEYQVGVTGGSHGVAAVPICASSESAEPEVDIPPPPPMASVWVNSHIAVAWHAHSPEVWATWGQRDSAKAEAIVLEACNATMGGGCGIAQSGYNGTIAIARDNEGKLRSTWGEDEKDAKANMKTYCDEQKITCKVFNIFKADAWREPAYFGELERQIADNTGVYQEYRFPKTSRIAAPK